VPFKFDLRRYNMIFNGEFDEPWLEGEVGAPAHDDSP
jgi:hypothetical protein